MNRKERRKLAKKAGPVTGAQKAVELTTKGMALAQAGENNEAIAVYLKSLEFDAKNTDTHYVLGVLYKRLGQLEVSIEHYRKAVVLQPAHFDAFYNLGNVLSEQGKLNDAIDAFEKVIVLNPTHAMAYNNLGNVQLRLGLHLNATLSYKRSLELNPQNLSAMFNLGDALREDGEIDEAIEIFQKLLALDPDHVETLNNLGSILRDQLRFTEAVTVLRKAVESSPDLAKAQTNLGNVLRDLELLDEAFKCFQKALTLDPNSAKALSNFGNLLQDMQRLDDAAECHQKALLLDPDSAEVHFNQGLHQLTKGDYLNGWPNYDWRWKLPENKIYAPIFNFPVWQGQPLEGKILLLWDEQGIGDAVLFASMLPDLIKRGGDLHLQCEPRLLPLFSRSFPQIKCTSKITGSDIAMNPNAYDFHIPLGNLARILRPNEASFESHKPHIVADPVQKEALRARYKAGLNGPTGSDNLLVGIAWFSTGVNSAQQKSISLTDLKPVLEIPGITFVDLQYGDTQQQRSDLEAQTGIHLIHDDTINQMVDLDGFAAQTAAMDYVISIDNTTSHMAGSLGVPTLLMLRHICFWYWMTERNDSPWYASHKLLRQSKPNDWSNVIGQLVDEVKALGLKGF